MQTPTRHERWKMFDRIAPTYDVINKIISFGRAKSWHKKVARYLPEKKALSVLDVATGTADQLITLFEECPNVGKGIGIDLSTDMLKLGEQKLANKPYRKQISLQKGDGEKIPFPESSFDAVTLTFGIRNFPSPIDSLKEIHRVLKPKGRALILEFSLPPEPIKSPYLFYLRYIIPYIGQFLSKDKEAYRYLNQTIETFPYGNEFINLMRDAGFTQLQIIPMSLGAVSLYVGSKP